jgi:hypothetical protein
MRCLFLTKFSKEVYNENGREKEIARTASYDELKENPKQLKYDPRTADALEGREIPQIDTRIYRQIPSNTGRKSEIESVDGQSIKSGLQESGTGQRGNLRDTDTGRTQVESETDEYIPAEKKSKSEPLTASAIARNENFSS